MNIKSHPDYWNTHKEIYQQEYDNLNSQARERVVNEPYGRDARELDLAVRKLIERKLLSLVE